MSEKIHNLLKIENDNTTIFTNQELKTIDDYINELEAYKYNLDRDYLRLEKENQELKEQVDYLRKSIERKEETIIELEHERVPYINEYVEELKKQLEEKNKPQIFIDTQDIEERYAEGLYQDYLEEENKKYKNQQKEFIEWLTNEANINPYDISDYVYEDIINTILSKYEDIIEK